MSDVDSDLDDLDDLLPTFQQPAPAAGPSATHPSARTKPPAAAASPDADDDDDDEAAFAAAFERNMARMLADLAGDDPSGAAGAGGAPPPLAEGAGAWERAFEQALADASTSAATGGDVGGSGNSAGNSRSQPSSASLSASAGPAAATAAGAARAPDAGGPATGKPDFKQTVRETVDRLKASSDGAGSSSGAEDPLAALLASLGLDPDALDGASAGLGGAGAGAEDDDDGVLERMMQGLMSKDVLYEPMCELADKYPPYLASPAARALDPATLHAYTAQADLVREIVAVFRRPTYTEEGPRSEEIRLEVQALMGRMQDLGSPPAEVMGEMPDFELGADGLPKLPAGLDGPEGCVIC